MQLEILHVPDCPQVSPLLKLLERVTHLPVTTTMIDSIELAASRGMTGSPTLLVEDTDAFPPSEEDRRAGGLSCRLFRDHRGRTSPLPTVDQLRDALTARSLDPGADLRRS
ncbi:alkylmercury lyase [Microlunatus speluncae]|uniref:alkylmercury lyase n=1 Tax=Microlunatus speluncae TaxID=2594267 RepID=UPI00126647EC|nr:alkylmercury lyase [Microlunatus speluncae]